MDLHPNMKKAEWSTLNRQSFTARLAQFHPVADISRIPF